MIDRDERPSSRLTLPVLWVLAAGAVSLVGSPLRTSTHAPLAPGAVGADFSYMRTAFHYSLSLAGMLAVFAIVYAVLALTGARYRGWMGYVHLALSAGGALLLLSPALFLALMLDLSRDPVTAFKIWNGVSAIGYAMTLAGVAMLVAVLIDAWRRGRSRAKPSAALP